MSYTIQKKSLNILLQRAFPVVPSKTTLQILLNFRIAVNQGILSVAATDLEHSIIVEGNVDSAEGSAELAVNARKLFEVVRELPEGSVEINFDGGVLSLKSEKGFSCRIAGAEAKDFPGFPEIQKAEEFEMDIALLGDLLQKSGFAVSKDESRACLCGILWEIDKNRTGMVATDGHRLGCSFLSVDTPVASKQSPILAPRTLSMVTRAIAPTGDRKTVSVCVAEKYVLFGGDGVRICCKRIDGPYPDYRRAIPADNPKKVVLERSALLDAVRRVAILSSQRTNLLRISFRPSEAEVAVSNRELAAEARETLPVQYDGPEHTLGFNGQYLAEILGIISTPRVRIEMNTQISACLLFPLSDDKDTPKAAEDLFLIMPLRILDEI